MDPYYKLKVNKWKKNEVIENVLNIPYTQNCPKNYIEPVMYGEQRIS